MLSDLTRFYLIDDLADAIENQLSKLKDEHEPMCRVPVITSPEEEHLIVSSSCKVSVCVNAELMTAQCLHHSSVTPALSFVALCANIPTPGSPVQVYITFAKHALFIIIFL